MAITRARPTKKEPGYLLLGLILGAILSFLSNYAVTAHFKIFNPSGILLYVLFVLSIGGFFLILIGLFLMVRKLLK